MNQRRLWIVTTIYRCVCNSELCLSESKNGVVQSYYIAARALLVKLWFDHWIWSIFKINHLVSFCCFAMLNSLKHDHTYQTQILNFVKLHWSLYDLIWHPQNGKLNIALVLQPFVFLLMMMSCYFLAEKEDHCWNLRRHWQGKIIPVIINIPLNFPEYPHKHSRSCKDYKVKH